MQHIFEYLINRKLTAKDANKHRLRPNKDKNECTFLQFLYWFMHVRDLDFDFTNCTLDDLTDYDYETLYESARGDIGFTSEQKFKDFVKDNADVIITVNVEILGKYSYFNKFNIKDYNFCYYTPFPFNAAKY